MRLFSIVQSILSEVVPFEKAADVEKGMIEKHGFDSLREDTFGIEIEFEPVESDIEDIVDIAKQIDPADLISIINSNDRNGGKQLEHDYEEWLYDRRRSFNKYTRRNGWDDSYGPPNEDEWTDIHEEPEDEEEKKEWDRNRIRAALEHRKWERLNMYDHMEEFVKENAAYYVNNYIDDRSLISNLQSPKYASKYYDILSGYRVGKEYYIKQVSDALESVGEKTGPYPTETQWNVGEDGDNVEIRSRHLKSNDKDFSLIYRLFDFMRDNGYKVHDETSAHIHVGLPEKFDSFSLLALTTLVDEEKVKTDVGKRNLERWAALRKVFDGKIATFINAELNGLNKRTKKDDKGNLYVDFTDASLGTFLNMITVKYTGTNIKSFWQHGTVEFRYFGSNIRKIDTLMKWVQYFMLLPRVAASRREIKVGTIYFKKHDGGRITASLTRNIVLPAAPRFRDVKI